MRKFDAVLCYRKSRGLVSCEILSPSFKKRLCINSFSAKQNFGYNSEHTLEPKIVIREVHLMCHHARAAITY